MKKYENFCLALSNMQEIYKYEKPYDTVILTGLVGLYEICTAMKKGLRDLRK